MPVAHRLEPHKTAYSPSDIPTLVAALASGNGMVREQARKSLIALGKPAVKPLAATLQSRDRQVRWEAAKALRCLCDPESASALVEALGDERIGVRWLAAEGLIALEHEGLGPLFAALLDAKNADRLGEGAHHVLHDLSKKLGDWFLPVLHAIDDAEPSIAVPIAAFAALQEWKQQRKRRR